MVNAILRVFPDARVQSGYVRIRCPYHKGGKERRPSMSILLEDRGNMPAGTCHCFACGKVVTLEQLFQDIGKEYLERIEVPQAKKKVELSDHPLMFKPQLPYRFSKYLASRGISAETQERFKIYEKDDKVYMPVFSRDGRYLYFNARELTRKRFYVEGGKEKSLWGIEEIDLSRPIMVCEAQIDALSLWEAGFQAVATLGADNLSALEMIKSSTSIIILAFDPDEAGEKATKKAIEILGRFRCRRLDLPTGIDVNRALTDIQDIEVFRDYIQRITVKV